MIDEKPGAPPETEKPKPKNTSKPEFSFRDLIFDAAFSVDNRKYLRFFCEAEFPCFIDITRADYMEYANLYFDQFEKCEEEEKCTCDKVSPKYEEIDKITFEFVKINENKEETTIIEEFPLFLVYDLPQSFQISIHGKHE